MKTLHFFIVLFCLALTAKAQTVYDVISDPTKNYYDVVNYYNEYFKTHERGKGSGYKMFKRWETEMKYWIDENGNRIPPEHYNAELNKFSSGLLSRTSSSTCVANWTELGPTNWNRTSSWSPGLGRIDAIAIHPLNTNVIYVGSPNGGCWKTTNGGTNWISLTDGQVFMQIGDVEVDPTNLNTVYIGTLGSGMLVSTNGGVTLTPSNAGLPAGVNIRKIIVDPNNTANVLIATTSGIYRSTNSGASWTQAIAGSFLDMDFKPGNSSVVYACGTNFYRSTNGGANFTQITSGITSSGIMRLAVSPANPNLVCIVQCAGSVFGKFYKSTDGGTSFITTVTGNSANGTNFFGYSPQGTDNSGQGGYNIDITISPTNADEIHIAGIITWKSSDGGYNFVSTTEWTYPNARGYTHCDVHALEYIGNKLFVGSDGGISVSTDMGDNFTGISSGLGIRMFYRLGCAKTNSITIATGAQDNGGSVRTATGWIDWIGADGMETAVDHTNANIIYGSSQNGTFYKTTNGGNSYSGLNTPSTNGNWTTPFVIDPNVNTTLYVGYNELYKSTNSGVNWTAISNINIGDLDHIAVAPSNSNYIYISSGNKIYRTTDGGTTWTNIATGLSSLTINGIAVHNSNPDKVAVATSSSRIYTSTNGGVAWTNSTGNFPAVSARCIVYQNDASEALYVGTNTGVYYKDNTMTSWISFANGLPKVGVNELEIHYASSKIRAATYGRGIWESDICSASTSTLDIAIENIIDPVNGSTVCNNNVTPKVSIKNLGSSTITSAIILYKMDATATQTLNWAGSLATNASTVLTLNPYSGLSSSAHTFSVWANSPNAGVDQYVANNSMSSTYTVIAVPVGMALPFTEGFESGSTPPAGWVIQKANTIDAAVSWSVVSNATGLTAGSTKVARMDNYSSSMDISGQIDALRSPAISFTAANTSLSLNFDVSHRPYGTTSDIDTLNVYISTDCGMTWSRLYTKGGAQLATVAGTQTGSAYSPTVNTQWRRETVNLSSYAGLTSVYFKFESRSGWGNNVFLDNINISYTVAASPAANFSVASTPACTGSILQLTDMSTNSPTTWTWTATSPSGVTFSNANVKNPTVSFANAGTYTISLSASNANGTGTTTKTITVNATPTVAVSNATICSGSAATLSASGATSYNWNTGATTSSISVTPTVATNYTVTGTTNGCVNTKTVSVTVTATPTVAVSNATICTGNAATLSASGATTYSWNTGATTSSISVSPTTNTNYTITGTTNGCTNTKTVSVTVKATPTVAVSNATVCSGSAATLSASGATTYNWNTGATTSSISVSPTTNTNYTVTGTTNGCTNTRTVSVSVNATPTVAVSNATICSGNATTLSASGATTYNWNTGATTSSISVSPTINTNYTITGTTNGCANTKTVSVTVKATPTVAVNNATVCSGNAVTLTANGATTYNWSTGATTSSISVTPTVATNYTVTGTANGCVNTKTVGVNVNTTPTANAGTGGTITCTSTTLALNGSGVTTYTWSGPGIVSGGNTASPVVNAAGTYTLVGSASGCTSTPKTVTVNANNTAPSVTSSSSGTITCATPTVNAMVSTTTSPVSYNWSGSGIVSGASTATINVNQGGTYNYTVTNTANGCKTSGSRAVTINTVAPTVSASSATICAGGSATLTASGSAATYSWNTGATGANLVVSPTTNTSYTVSATGSNGCKANATANVVVGSAPAIVVNSQSICTGETATLTASGVTTYTWSTGSNGTSISVNPSATTVYTVSGNLTGCAVTAMNTTTVTVNTPTTPTVSPIAGPLCVNSSTVALSATPAGGTFSGLGVSGSTFDPAASGSGTIAITYSYVDGNSCTGSDVEYITVSLCTSITELEGSSISVYPNPAKDKLVIQLDESYTDVTTIELYDAIGKLVIEEKVNTSVTNLNVSKLAKGIYSVRITSANHKAATIRIIKE